MQSDTEIDMEVQISETKDHELLAILNKEVQELHHSLYPNIFKPYNQEGINSFFKETLEQNTTKAFVAYMGKEAAGYIILFLREVPENPFQYSQRFILIDQIGVKSEFRKNSIGKLLLDKVYEIAKEEDFKMIRLNHWTMNNMPRAFFSKHGFSYFNEQMWKLL